MFQVMRVFCGNSVPRSLWKSWVLKLLPLSYFLSLAPFGSCFTLFLRNSTWPSPWKVLGHETVQESKKKPRCTL